MAVRGIPRAAFFVKKWLPALRRGAMIVGRRLSTAKCSCHQAKDFGVSPVPGGADSSAPGY